ncbi:MAG TPA: HlyD family efflux transporter periplasmic adaptor subunit [Gammaproteobacteria bacterium]|nr:HlyD family efflux transporter periplasmic adaptor subunit [Gammaproteobacteria bacterium]
MRPYLRPISLLCAALITACSHETALPLNGTLERDRIELVAEDQEPVVEIAVHEGDRVKAGQLILRLDDSRYRTLVAQTRAARDQAAARIGGAEATLTAAEKDFDRTQKLVAQHTRSVADLDRSRAELDNARSTLGADRAALAQTQATLDQDQITLDRLTLRAPRDATVDSLPYHIGERPPIHAVVAVLLDASGAYAQIYVPEPLRTGIHPGLKAVIRFDGGDKPYAATVRYVSADAAFTPYYALNERDRSRLAYLAKVYLDDSDGSDLPTGAPVSVDFPELHR